MRVNSIPVSIMATALATSQLQAFMIPSVALGVEWSDATLASSAKLSRTVNPGAEVDGIQSGTVVKISVRVTADKDCQQFWVIDNFLTDDLTSQGFKLLTTGAEAPHSLSTTNDANSVTVTPEVTPDGRTIRFTMPNGMLAGQTAGIEYYLASPNTEATGVTSVSLGDWVMEKNGMEEGGTFKHLGEMSMVTSLSSQSQETPSDENPGNGTGSPAPSEASATASVPVAGQQEQASQGGATAGSQPTSSTTPAGGTNGTSNGTKPKGDLVATGTEQTMAVIISAISAISGMSVLVLKRLQGRH